MTDWIWPFEDVQTWFEDLWNWISEAANAAGEWVWQQVEEGLNWLMDQVTIGLEWLLTQVREYIGYWDFKEERFKGGFLGWLWDSLAAIGKVLGDIAQAAWEGLSEIGGWLISTIWGWVEGSLAWLTDTFQWLSDVVTEGLSWAVGELKVMLDGGLAWFGKAIEDLINGMGRAMFEGLKWLYEKLSDLWGAISAGITWFIDTASDFFSGVIDGLVTTIREALSPASPPKETLENMTKMAEDWTKMIQQKLKEVAKSPLELKDALAVATGIAGVGLGVTGLSMAVAIAADAAHPMKLLGSAEAAKLLLGYLGVNTTIAPIITVPYERGVLTPLRHFFNTVYESEIPGHGEMVTMNMRLVLAEDEYIEASKLHGLPEEWSVKARDASYDIPGLQEMFQLNWRGLLTEEELKTWITKTGIHPDFIDKIINLRDLIPGPTDWIRFVVREVITPEQFYEWMPKIGFSAEIAGYYWDAHFELPARRELVDAYHRGVITEDELNKYLFWHDYQAEKRPGISKTDIEILRGIEKTLIPRVDLRRGWEMGIIQTEELVDRYEFLGFEDDAEKMATIQMRVAMEAEISGVRRQVISDYVKGHISEATLRANLEAFDYSSEIVEYYVEAAKRRLDREYREDLLDLYRDGYMKDLITEDELNIRVMEILVNPEVAELFIEKAHVDKYKKPYVPKYTEEELAKREANKYRISAAIQAYRRYAIEKAEMISEFIDAEVHPLPAAARADYEEIRRPLPKPSEEEVLAAKEAKKIQKLEERILIERYRQDIIDEGDLLQGLQDIGYSLELATSETQLQILRKPLPKPTPEERAALREAARIQKLEERTLIERYRQDLIDETDLVSGLVTLGYSEALAIAIADLEILKKPEPKPSPEEVAAAKEAARILKAKERTLIEDFKDERISEDDLYSGLVDLGYSGALARAITDLEAARKYKPPKPEEES